MQPRRSAVRLGSSRNGHWKNEGKKDEKRVIRRSKYTNGTTLYCSGAPKKPQSWDDSYGNPPLHEQSNYSHDCPFCVGHEGNSTDPALWVDEHGNMRTDELQPGWQVRALANIFPLINTPRDFYPERHYEQLRDITHSQAATGQNIPKGTLADDELNATGISEVVVSSPLCNGQPAIQSKQEVAWGLQVVQERGRAIRGREDIVKDMSFIKQYGQMSGGSLRHPHYQIMTFTFVTRRHEERIKNAHKNFVKYNECLTCVDLRNVRDRSHKEHSRFLHENKHFVALVARCGQQHGVHIVPKQHSHSWLDMPPEHMPALGDALQLILQAVYDGFGNPHYILYWVTADTQAHHDVADGDLKKKFHWWLEVVPRLVGDFGAVEADVSVRVAALQGLPEEFAAELRKVIERRKWEESPFAKTWRYVTKVLRIAEEEQAPKKQLTREEMLEEAMQRLLDHENEAVRAATRKEWEQQRQ